MQARIQVGGTERPVDELTSLRSWLAGEGSLRGAVRMEAGGPRSGAMGGLSEVLVVALGNGGAITALAASLGTWLVTRRSHIKIKVTGSDGAVIELDVKRAKGDRAGVEALLRETLGRSETESG